MFKFLKRKMILDHLRDMLGDAASIEERSDFKGQYYEVRIKKQSFEVKSNDGTRVLFTCPRRNDP